MYINYCYTCDAEYSTLGNLMRHFRSIKHEINALDAIYKITEEVRTV